MHRHELTDEQWDLIKGLMPWLYKQLGISGAVGGK